MRRARLGQKKAPSWRVGRRRISRGKRWLHSQDSAAQPTPSGSAVRCRQQVRVHARGGLHEARRGCEGKDLYAAPLPLCFLPLPAQAIEGGVRSGLFSAYIRVSGRVFLVNGPREKSWLSFRGGWLDLTESETAAATRVQINILEQLGFFAPCNNIIAISSSSSMYASTSREVHTWKREGSRGACRP